MNFQAVGNKMQVFQFIFLLVGICETARAQYYEDEGQQEVVIDEVVEDHVKQSILLDRAYNSSFTISIPMLTVVVPGTGKGNAIVRFSISHLTLWTLITTAAVGLVYPAFLGPHGKLHRSLDGRKAKPTLLENLESIINLPQIYNDIASLVPEEMTEHCLRRALCEAHKEEEDFGIGGKVLRGAAHPNVSQEFAKNMPDFCAVAFEECVVSPAEMYGMVVKSWGGSVYFS